MEITDNKTHNIEATLGVVFRGKLRVLDDMLELINKEFDVSIVYHKTSNDQLFITTEKPNSFGR